jgi:NADH:ubiquinone oxidoreductase subunit E
MKFNPKTVTRIVQQHSSDKVNLLAILTDVQKEYNWLPPDALKMISELLCIPLIDVYGVASFYHAFSLTPRGKHIITICQGTACHVRGAPVILNRVKERLQIEPGCTTEDDQFTLETVNCLGACALAPVMVIDGKYHGHSTVQKINALLSRYEKKRHSKKHEKTRRAAKKKRSNNKKHSRQKGTQKKVSKKTK